MPAAWLPFSRQMQGGNDIAANACNLNLHWLVIWRHLLTVTEVLICVIYQSAASCCWCSVFVDRPLQWGRSLSFVSLANVSVITANKV
jgi:hypothetical protein